MGSIVDIAYLDHEIRILGIIFQLGPAEAQPFCRPSASFGRDLGSERPFRRGRRRLDWLRSASRLRPPVRCTSEWRLIRRFNGTPGYNCFIRSRLSRIRSRTRFLSALLSEEYSPCFQRERRDLAKPSGVVPGHRRRRAFWDEANVVFIPEFLRNE